MKPKKSAPKIPTLKPAKLPHLKSCSALHREIQYQGAQCPLCHEIESTKTLSAENAQLHARFAGMDLNANGLLTLGRIIEGLNKSVQKFHDEFAASDKRSIDTLDTFRLALGSYGIKLGAMDDAIAVLVAGPELPEITFDLVPVVDPRKGSCAY